MAFSVSSEHSSKFSYKNENPKKRTKGNNTKVENGIKFLKKESKEVRSEMQEIKSVLNILVRETNSIRKKIGY